MHEKLLIRTSRRRLIIFGYVGIRWKIFSNDEYDVTVWK